MHQVAVFVMGKLRNVQSSLTRLRSTVGALRDDDGHSSRAEPWRAWYSLASWKRLRMDVLTRDEFTCLTCRRVMADTSKLVADHITPHRGNTALFWNDANLQTLCDTCHSSLKQAAEHRAARGQG